MPADPVVYIIDDDAAVRDSLSFLLRSHKIEALTFDSALSFLPFIQDLKGGCIITDVRMPGLSGIDLLHRLSELGLEIPVIIITGHGDLQLAVEAMKLGAVDFLENPFNYEALV